VLNHLTDPVPGLAELARITRPGGAVLAAVFSNDSRSQDRDRIDAMALAAGWQVPGWYTELKTTAVPILGSRAAIASAARAGLASVHAEERPVDVGVTEPGLVTEGDDLCEAREVPAGYSCVMAMSFGSRRRG
jgi:SAM-dependent methyltransferase